MAATLTFVLPKGEDVTLSGIHETSADDTTPINITGWTIKFTVRYHENGALLFPAVTCPVTLGTAGTYTIPLSGLLSVNEGKYVCDVWRTDSGAKIEMGIGTLTIVRNPFSGI